MDKIQPGGQSYEATVPTASLDSTEAQLLSSDMPRARGRTAVEGASRRGGPENPYLVLPGQVRPVNVLGREVTPQQVPSRISGA